MNYSGCQEKCDKISLTHKTPFHILNPRKSNFLSINPDAMEEAAYEHFFGGGAKPLITSLKGATGKNFASGGIRAAALALSLREGIVPPVVGLKEPRCSLPFVIGASVNQPVRRGLLSGISFGGICACMVFEVNP